MAEFKLGRIRFVWKGQWAQSTAYIKDDVIRYGGKTFICQVSHTSDADFYTDLDFVPSKWNQLSDGQEWKGDWDTDTFYSVNDIVKYGGRLYICNTSHTSASTTTLGLEDDQASWDLFADGLDWKGDWTITTRYKVSDVVRHGGYTYVCNTAHTSTDSVTNGLVVDIANWDIFNPGVEYKGEWSNASQVYKLNDIVKFGPSLWICVAHHTSAGTFVSQQANWGLFVQGLSYEADWNVGTTYQPGDVVAYGGNQYVSKTNHIGFTPSTSATNWDLLSKGFKFIGAWSSVTAYKVGEIVRLNGYTYLSTADNTNQEPPNGAFWQQLNSGFFWKGEWVDDIEYKLGDVVKFGDNAYICILGHRSEGDDGSTVGPQGGGAANSRPDQDSTGTYWNLLSIGTETSVLTTKGDLVYYGGAGPTRLPIGTEGQILRAGEEYPEWVNLGNVDFTYYVAPHGTDLPAPIWGKSFDKPWKSIRYACEQVEKGPRNPNAQYLLELNRAFIQREVTTWIRNQIATNTPPFSSAFVYDDFKCERDVGFVIDRVIYDIGHGGNYKTRAAAQTLLNVLEDGPFSTEEDGNGTGPYANLSLERNESVAAYNYMLSLVEKVLDNEAPTIIYQNLVDDSTTIVDQYFNTDLTAEPTALPHITELVGIITTALSTQDPATIPERYVPNNLISVATGRYRETLPIIVPAGTCVQGDELRSTNAGPAGSLIDISDSYYTVTTFDRMSEVVSDIVVGNVITPTTGNNESQDQAAPVADTLESSAVDQLIQIMKHQSDFRLNSMHVATLTDPTGYNVGYLAGYGDARKLIKENKKFLQEEVIAFLTASYGGLKWQKTLTRRDVGYIVDAIVYDLTYGGNALSVKAGLAYYDGDDNTQPQISASIKAATIAAQTFLKTRMQQVATEATFTPSQTVIPRYRDTAGSASASTLIGDNLDDIIEIVNTGPAAVGTTVTLVDPSTAWVAGALTTAYTTLSSAFTTIKNNVNTFLTTTYPNLFDAIGLQKAERDAEIVLKAVGYDFMFDSTYQTVKAAHAYLRPTALELFTNRETKAATLASLEYTRTQAIANVGGNATVIARINAAMQIVQNIVSGVTNDGDICQTEERNRYYAMLQLERNRNFIVEEIRAYIADTFSDTATNTTVTTNLITISDTSWLKRNAAIRFTGTTFGQVAANTTYYVQKIISSTQFAIANQRNAADSSRVVLTTAAGSMRVELAYNQELCLRDVQTYIDALKYDLKYPGNYKSRYVARYYANAVLGSLEEDMYYLRDATGVRDMTLEGLSGDMTPENAYGTSRVTAGAYCSLDPGFGPEDFNAWILSRSPYVQGVTTIGTAAIGQKIDGALHNGGNDSIVSNDFTQVISDGIGAWVANNGRAELVSVFTYYAHIGYLSTEGGRIRGTNGNNSYGDFGSVAEGFDMTETPNTAAVDNRSKFKATITNAPTNGSQFFSLEYENAGNDYTEATFLLTGGGVNAVAVADELRDDGVFQVRLLDFGNDSSGQFGGQGYLTNANTAQGGTGTSITLAATDGELSTAYIGMKVVITGGTGAGQYALISTYNSGTKLASVIKESDGSSGWDHFVSGTTIVAPDASSTYIVEPAVSFNSPGFTSQKTTVSSSQVWRSAVYGDTTAVYTAVTGTYSGTGASGASFNVVRNGWKYTVSINAAGINYERLETITILGSALGGTDTVNDLIITITAINSITGAILDFDQDGYGKGGVFVAVGGTSSTAGSYSDNGVTWSASTMPSGTWNNVAYGLLDDQSTLQKTARFVAVASGTTSAYSANGISWTAFATALPTSATWTSVAFGNNRFVAIASDSTTVAISSDGERWDSTGTLPGTGFVSITYGGGKFVAVEPGNTGAAAYSIDGGVTWTPVNMPANVNWNSVAFGNNKFVATATNSNNGAYSLNGITWTAMTIGSVDGSSVAGYQQVKYGQGLFMATAYLAGSQDYSFVAVSEDGLIWNEQGVDANPNAISGYNALAFGNPQRTGTWLVIERDSGADAATIRTGARARARAAVAEERIFEIRILEPGSGYDSVPTITIVDPNNLYEVPTQVRIGRGVLANPTFNNRGNGYTTGSAEITTGDGFADFYQPGAFVAVRRITQRPVPGSNVVFDHLPGRTFKLVNVLTFLGQNDGSYTAFFQVSPELSIAEAPEHLEDLNTRLRYSQIRLTGHDFLDIGTGSFVETNYPNAPVQDPIPDNETVENNGGRVFYTSTDQDGNFRVGGLFAIEQSTGIATLNADAFNISGLQELNLGNVTLGGGSATITEFSTDPFFTADSNNVVPTQRAVKAYIASQIGGGGASLNVNSVTAGSIVINSNQITHVTNGVIKMNATFEFKGGVIGLPVAFNYFLV